MAEDTHVDETKGIVALAVFIIYVVTGLLWLGFSISGFLVLLSFFVLLFGLPMEEGEKKEKKILGIGRKEKILGLSVAYVVSFILWLANNAWNIWPDYSSRFILLMFAAAISAGMEIKNIVIFFGVSILTAIFFTSGILAVAVLIVVSLFIYSDRESATMGILMMIPLLIVGWFIGSGWAATVEQKVTGIGAQVSATTGINTESVGSSITSALNDTWLLLTDPNKWYEKQFVEKGNRDTGATSSALEITRIEALPNTVMPKDTFDIVFEMENKGTTDSESVNISAHAGDSLAAACGKIEGRYCLRSCPGGNLAPICKTLKALGKIAKKEKRFDSFTFQAPECPGTYTAGGRVSYSYQADATLSLQMIAREYYEELLRNNQMKWIDELSTASSGPFKLTLRTDRQQPIPDRTTDNNPQGFKIYLGLVNEHEGIAKLKSATLEVPAKLALVDYSSEETPNPDPKLPTTTYAKDKSCTLTYDATMTENDCRTKTNLGKCSDKDAVSVISFSDVSPASNLNDYLTISKAFKAQATKNGMVSYKPINMSAEMAQNDWKYYKCGFQLEKNTDGTAAKLSQIETLFLRTHIDYDFEYTKDAVITVRQTGAGGVPPKCQESAKKVSPIDSSQTTPQAKTDIISDLSDKIDTCWRNSDGWFANNNLCGTYKVDIAGCAGDIINGVDVLNKLKDFKSEAYIDNPIVVNTYDTNGQLTPLCTIGAADPQCTAELFNDRFVYTNLAVWYVASLFGDHIQVNIFTGPSYKQADTTDCKGRGEVCDAAGKGNCQTGLTCAINGKDAQPTCQTPTK